MRSLCLLFLFAASLCGQSDLAIYSADAAQPVLLWNRMADVSPGLQSLEAAEFSPDARPRGNYQQLADKRLNNRDLKKN